MALKTITVNVTATDIKRGTPYSNTSCPVNMAARRHFKDEIQITGKTLFYKIVKIKDMGKTTGAEIYLKPIALDKAVVFFNKRFDSGEEVKPFKFDLQVPEEALKPSEKKTKRCK